MIGTISRGNGPICQYCNTENDSVGSDYWAETKGEGEAECDHCGKHYRFSVDYETTYTAEQIEAKK